MKQLVLFVAALAVLVVLTRLFPVVEWANEITTTLRTMGPLGALLFVVGYGVLVSAFVPASPLSMLAGATWGLWEGTLIVVPACAVATTLSAVLGRTLLRSTAEAVTSKYPILSALDRAFSTDAFRMVVLLRLSPVLPFAVSNYGLGTTAAPMWAISLGTLIGIIPITIVWVYFGTIGESALQGGLTDSPLRLGMLIVGLVATFVLVGWIGKRAKRLLDVEQGAPEA